MVTYDPRPIPKRRGISVLSSRSVAGKEMQGLRNCYRLDTPTEVKDLDTNMKTCILNENDFKVCSDLMDVTAKLPDNVRVLAMAAIMAVILACSCDKCLGIYGRIKEACKIDGTSF